MRRHEIDAVPTATGSAAGFEHQLPAIRAELDQQRRFRTEQLEKLAVDAAEAAVSTADQNRLEVTRVSPWPRNRPWKTSTPRCTGWRRTRTESASAAPSRSRGNGWRCCR